MVIRIRCRRVWVSTLMRSLRKEVVPLPLRRQLIVVDEPKLIGQSVQAPMSRVA